jgi:hypothetical protein
VPGGDVREGDGAAMLDGKFEGAMFDGARLGAQVKKINFVVSTYCFKYT